MLMDWKSVDSKINLGALALPNFKTQCKLCVLDCVHGTNGTECVTRNKTLYEHLILPICQSNPETDRERFQ